MKLGMEKRVWRRGSRGLLQLCLAALNATGRYVLLRDRYLSEARTGAC